MNLRRNDTRDTAYVSGAIVLTLLLLAPGTAAVTETVTISGEVEAADYDDDGEVTEVAIYDGEWGAVLVLKTGKGAELLNQIGAYVTAKGEIRELDDDTAYFYAIEVTSYTIGEPMEPEEGAEGNAKN